MRMIALNQHNRTFILIAVTIGSSLLLGIASLWFSPLWVLAGLAASVFAVIILKRPEVGLLSIVIITSGLVDDNRLPLLSLASISFHITDLILLYLLALVFVQQFTMPRYHLIGTPLDIPLFFFYIVILISALTAFISPSVDKSWVFRQLRPLTYYLGFFCVTNLIRTSKALLFLLMGLFGIAILGSLAMALQVVAPTFQLVNTKSIELVTAGQEYFGVARSYLQVDRLIYLLLLISICSLSLNGKILSRKFENGFAAILAIGLFLTFQRNYWTTFLLMFALLGLLIRWSGKLYLFKLIVLSISIILVTIILHINLLDKYIAAASDRLIRGMQPHTLQQDVSVQWRVMETRYGVQSILQHPILGIGLGNFYRPAVPADAYLGTIGNRWYIHNAYLWVLIDMGLVGFIPFILLYAAAIIRGFRYWERISDQRLKVILLGGTLGIFGQAISNIVAPSFFQDWMVLIFAIIMGINELIIKWEVGPNPSKGGKHLKSRFLISNSNIRNS